MATAFLDRAEVVEAIQAAASSLGRSPSRSEFLSRTGTTEYQILKHFRSWNEAVEAAGLQPNVSNVFIDPNVLLEDWGRVVRKMRQIPTRVQYRREGSFSPGVFERKFGPWSAVPAKFREFAGGNSDWLDVVALLPIQQVSATSSSEVEKSAASGVSTNRHNRLSDRPTYGNPIDFRGLRHEPVNEQGVVFLFGMIARELGYQVEAVQTGYPDCEAKRQISEGKWQRVRIEFEFESRNFRDHGHPIDGCDVIVCWRHNWAECPAALEVVELSTIIRTLSDSDD